MPFANTWSEELVAEWLAIKGYLVETNIPIGTGRGGGRKEADVVGVNLKKDEIVHIEVGSLADSPQKVIDRYSKKFKDAENFLKKKKGIREKTIFRQIIVATWISKPVIKTMRKKFPHVELYTFEEFIKEKIMPEVEKYVKQEKLFPANYWFLNFLWYLKKKKLIE